MLKAAPALWKHANHATSTHPSPSGKAHPRQLNLKLLTPVPANQVTSRTYSMVSLLAWRQTSEPARHGTDQPPASPSCRRRRHFNFKQTGGAAQLGRMLVGLRISHPLLGFIRPRISRVERCARSLPTSDVLDLVKDRRADRTNRELSLPQQIGTATTKGSRIFPRLSRHGRRGMQLQPNLRTRGCLSRSRKRARSTAASLLATTILQSASSER